MYISMAASYVDDRLRAASRFMDTSANQTPLQKNVEALGAKIGVLAIIVCIVVPLSENHRLPLTMNQHHPSPKPQRGTNKRKRYISILPVLSYPFTMSQEHTQVQQAQQAPWICSMLFCSLCISKGLAEPAGPGYALGPW